MIALVRERLRFYYTETAYPFFDYCKGEGEVLIKILMDLMKYENDELRLSSTKLLFDIFQVCISSDDNWELLLRKDFLYYLQNSGRKDIISRC